MAARVITVDLANVPAFARTLRGHEDYPMLAEPPPAAIAGLPRESAYLRAYAVASRAARSTSRRP